MRTTILQPTYLPWLGYFEMISSTEQFIVFDHVQFEPKSWQQRNYIKGPNGKIMLSVPVLSDGTQQVAIKDKRIDQKQPWQKKHLKSLWVSYKKAPYFDSYYPEIRNILEKKQEYLSDMTLSLVKLFIKQLGISTKIRRSSMILTENDDHLDKTERVVNLCVQAQATALYDGRVAAEFLALEKFASHGIDVHFQHYIHPEYPQIGKEFVPYMSIVDLLFNCGPQSLEILKKGVK